MHYYLHIGIGVGGHFRLGGCGSREGNLPEYSEPDRGPFGGGTEILRAKRADKKIELYAELADGKSLQIPESTVRASIRARAGPKTLASPASWMIRPCKYFSVMA